MNSSAEWGELTKHFKSFGGQIENIAQQEGPLGLGLFPINPGKKLQLVVPEHLLVPADNVELKDGKIVIIDDTKFPQGYAEWFSHYQSSFSWGAEGEVSVSTFEKGLQNLPDNVRMSLNRLGIYQPKQRMPHKDNRENMLLRFLKCRCLGRKGRLLVMPILELVNHSPLAPNWESHANGDVGISGLFSGEILVKYSNSDPLRRLMTYGFNCREQMAFSLNINVQHRGQTVKILGGGGRHWFQAPEVKRKGDVLIIRQPLLGFKQGPKLPLSLFLKACKNIADIDACELFEQIHQCNIIALVNLLKILDKQACVTACLLRRGCMNQLLALSDHVGLRPELVSALDEKSSVTRHFTPNTGAFM